MTRMVLGHARRSILVLLAPAVVAMYSFGFISNFDEWRWEWDLGTLLPGATFYLVGPIVAASAAFDAYRARFATAPLAPWRSHALRSAWPSYLLISISVFAIWLVVQAATVATLAVSDAFGQVRWAHVLTQVLAIFAFTAMGSTVGALVPRVWVPPLVGVAIWGAMALTLTTERLFPSAAVQSIADVPLPPERALWLTLFYVALIAVVLPYPHHWRSFTAMIRTVGAVAGAAMAVVLWTVTPNPPESTADMSACAPVTDDLEVCTTDTYAAALPYLVVTIGDTTAPIREFGVELPSPIQVVNTWIEEQALGGGVVIGVSSAELKEGWQPPPNSYWRDFRDVVIFSLVRGSCPEWWSSEGPGWHQSAAAEVLGDWLRSHFYDDVEPYLDSWDALDRAAHKEALPRLLDATYQCDVAELEKIFTDIGIDTEW